MGLSELFIVPTPDQNYSSSATIERSPSARSTASSTRSGTRSAVHSESDNSDVPGYGILTDVEDIVTDKEIIPSPTASARTTDTLRRILRRRQ